MLREYILHYNRRETDGGEENVPVQIIRSSRKSIGLQVKESGEVLARIPARLSDWELREFLEAHRQWVLQKVLLARQSAGTRKTTGAVPVQGWTPQRRKESGRRLPGGCAITAGSWA